MKQELFDQLSSKYPRVFRKITYITCSDGWFEIVNSMCSLIEDYISKLPLELQDQVYAEQIKQKFGPLRVYFSKNISYIDGVIDMAEMYSKFVCEECGSASGEIRSLSYVQVLCEECLESQKKTIKESYEAFRTRKK